MGQYRELMRYLHRAALLSERVGDRIFQRRIGIGRTSFLVLHSIADGEHLSQQALADQLSLTKGAVSRHVEVAERRGWLRVERSPASRRTHALALTPAGRELVERGRAVQREYERLGGEVMGDSDVAATIRTLRAMCELLESEERR